MFKGVLPALITPFTQENEIDREGLERNIEFVIEGGVTGVVPCGTTGESATLSFDEHKRIIDIVVEVSTVPVVAGTGSNNTTEAIELTKYAEDAGADAALLITPYYNKPNDKGMLQHYKTIASKVEIPLILYNVPTRTSINLKPEVVAELARVDNIVAIKEASGSLEQVSRIIEQTRDQNFVVLSGDDALTLPIMALGGVGVVSVAANVVPERITAMVEAFNDGKMDAARGIHFELAPLIRSLFLETNPIPVKRAVELIGLAGGPLRLPLAAMSSENERILIKSLEALGLL